MPPETVDAFLDHGKVELTLEKDLDEAYAELDQLKELGIDLSDVTYEILGEGVEKFIKPFDTLMQTNTEKQSKLISA